MDKHLAAVIPLGNGPLRMSEYIMKTRDLSAEDLQSALDAKLLHASYPLGGPEPIIYLLPNGNELLNRI